MGEPKLHHPDACGMRERVPETDDKVELSSLHGEGLHARLLNHRDNSVY